MGREEETVRDRQADRQTETETERQAEIYGRTDRQDRGEMEIDFSTV